MTEPRQIVVGKDGRYDIVCISLLSLCGLKMSLTQYLFKDLCFPFLCFVFRVGKVSAIPVALGFSEEQLKKCLDRDVCVVRRSQHCEGQKVHDSGSSRAGPPSSKASMLYLVVRFVWLDAKDFISVGFFFFHA